MKICVVTPHFPSKSILGYGDGLFLLKEARLLIERGHEVVVVACRRRGLPKFEVVDGIAVYRVSCFMVPKILYPIPDVFQLLKVLLNVKRRHRIELLDFWGQLYLTSLPILMAKRIVRLPVSVSVAGLPGINWFYGNKIVDLVGLLHSYSLTMLILAEADGVRSEHSSLTAALAKLGFGAKTSTIGRAVDIVAFRPDANRRREKRKELAVKENEVVVLFVGRFAVVKGIEYLIQAATRLLKEYTNLRFMLVGEGFLREEYEGQARRQQGIVFLGQRSDVNELMQAADILVLPSLSEGCSAVLLEAGASSLPIVATGVGGNVEVVRNGVTGFCTPPKNDIELSIALKRLIESPSLREEMGRKGRELISRLSDPNVIAGKVERYYQSLLNRCYIQYQKCGDAPSKAYHGNDASIKAPADG